MRYAHMVFGFVALFVLAAACAVVVTGPGGEAKAWSPKAFAQEVPVGVLEARPEAPFVTPVRTFRECQEIARCTGCRPVYRCRSCEFKRACSRGRCEWRDVCVWGPDRPVLPPNARIIRGPLRR